MSALAFPDFKGQAACATTDPEAYFPEQGGNATAAQAKAICNGCPVNTACLQWALTNDEAGIWGGLTEEERKRLTGPRPAPTGRPLEPINHGREAGAKAHRRRGEQPCSPCLTAERIARRIRQSA